MPSFKSSLGNLLPAEARSPSQKSDSNQSVDPMFDTKWKNEDNQNIIATVGGSSPVHLPSLNAPPAPSHEMNNLSSKLPSSEEVRNFQTYERSKVATPPVIEKEEPPKASVNLEPTNLMHQLSSVSMPSSQISSQSNSNDAEKKSLLILNPDFASTTKKEDEPLRQNLRIQLGGSVKERKVFILSTFLNAGGSDSSSSSALRGKKPVASTGAHLKKVSPSPPPPPLPGTIPAVARSHDRSPYSENPVAAAAPPVFYSDVNPTAPAFVPSANRIQRNCWNVQASKIIAPAPKQVYDPRRFPVINASHEQLFNSSYNLWHPITTGQYLAEQDMFDQKLLDIQRIDNSKDRRKYHPLVSDYNAWSVPLKP